MMEEFEELKKLTEEVLCLQSDIVENLEGMGSSNIKLLVDSFEISEKEKISEMLKEMECRVNTIVGIAEQIGLSRITGLSAVEIQTIIVNVKRFYRILFAISNNDVESNKEENKE